MGLKSWFAGCVHIPMHPRYCICNSSEYIMIISLLQYLHSGSMGPLPTHPSKKHSILSHPSIHPLHPPTPIHPLACPHPPIHPPIHPPNHVFTHPSHELGKAMEEVVPPTLPYGFASYTHCYCHRTSWTIFMVPLELCVTTSTSFRLLWHWIMMPSRQMHVHHSMQ